MKKNLFSVLFIMLCLVLVGCSKTTQEEEKKDGGWTETSTIEKANIDATAQKAFAAAKKSYTEMDLEPIALLGTQAVAGTNYMFLARNASNEKETELKVVVVYKDLEKESKITKVTDFDYKNYASKNIELSDEQLAGGWNVNSVDPEVKLEKDVQEAFDNALKGFTGSGYKPIALLGTQVVAGTNYAVLCLGTTTSKNPVNTINVLTIYKDLDGTSEVSNIATLNLSDFN